MLTGGFIVDHVSWRWVFLGPAVVMTLVWLLSFQLIPSARLAKNAATKGPFVDFDLSGTVLFGCSSFCLLLAVNRANDMGWTSPPVIGLAATALLLTPFLALV